jgi:hypothetical protein
MEINVHVRVSKLCISVIRIFCVVAGAGWNTMNSHAQWIVWQKNVPGSLQSAGKPCLGFWAQSSVQTVHAREQTSLSFMIASVGSAYSGLTPASVSIVRTLPSVPKRQLSIHCSIKQTDWSKWEIWLSSLRFLMTFLSTSKQNDGSVQ